MFGSQAHDVPLTPILDLPGPGAYTPHQLSSPMALATLTLASPLAGTSPAAGSTRGPRLLAGGAANTTSRTHMSMSDPSLILHLARSPVKGIGFGTEPRGATDKVPYACCCCSVAVLQVTTLHA